MSAPLRVLHLYRPRLPSTRAQSIQVLGTCHGLASLGCEVTLLADAPRDNMPVEELPSVEEVLAFYQLPPVEGLDLRLAPTSLPSAQSFWFRKHVLLWVIDSIRHHSERSVILGRAKRYIDEYLMLPWGPPVVLEAHEVDSRLAVERGEPDKAIRKLESRLLLEAQGLVGNCEGTLALLAETHPGTLPDNARVVYNATNPLRVRNHLPGAEGVVGYAGSLRSFKGMATLVEAARLCPQLTVELVGGSEEEREALGGLPSNLRLVGELPYTQVPDRVARWRSAVVSLDDDVFGRHLSNPLKLWDYLAVGVPLVLPELPTLREIVGPDEARWYRPGDPRSLAEALRSPPLRPRRRLRSWEQRASELLPVLEASLR